MEPRRGRPSKSRDRPNWRSGEVSPIDRDRVLQVGELFAREPVQWGLCGDPYVWAAMREQLADIPMPSDWFDLRTLLYEAFRGVVGVEPDELAPESVYLPETDRGAMSSGMVHLPSWRDRLIPILIDRSAYRDSFVGVMPWGTYVLSRECCPVPMMRSARMPPRPSGGPLGTIGQFRFSPNWRVKSAFLKCDSAALTSAVGALGSNTRRMLKTKSFLCEGSLIPISRNATFPPWPS